MNRNGIDIRIRPTIRVETVAVLAVIANFGIKRSLSTNEYTAHGNTVAASPALTSVKRPAILLTPVPSVVEIRSIDLKALKVISLRLLKGPDDEACRTWFAASACVALAASIVSLK